MNIKNEIDWIVDHVTRETLGDASETVTVSLIEGQAVIHHEIFDYIVSPEVGLPEIQPGEYPADRFKHVSIAANYIPEGKGPELVKHRYLTYLGSKK